MFIAISLVTVIASMFGMFVAYWTSKEMKQHLKWIKYCYLAFLLLFAISLLIKCAGCLFSIASLLVGAVVMFLMDHLVLGKEFSNSSAETWILVAAALAGVFTIDFNWGFIVAYFASLHNMVYGSLNVLPFVGKRHNGSKQIAEQLLYLATGIVIFYVLSSIPLLFRSMFTFAIAGALLYLFVKKCKKVSGFKK